jgi:UDP-N-acetylglucosamine 2-epimerase (non-hydrolysing)
LRVAVIFGTRPEAIKMAPVVKALRATPGIECRVWSTGQHRQMLDQVLDFFEIQTDVDLQVMTPGQTLNGIFAAVLAGVDRTIEAEKPDLVLVHGDTSTAAAAAVAAFHRQVPVGHVEAGLRSGRLDQPWPEEFNRRTVDLVAQRLYAPTARSRDNLLAEGVPAERILVTGNTVIDALLDAVERVGPGTALRAALDQRFDFLDADRPMVLVTGHRRESFGDGFREICVALRRLSERGDVQIVYPVHLNPNVQAPVKELLADAPGVYLIDPVDYPSFVYLMSRSRVILTDSGGVQEEAPSLGKPLLVMRDVTERPEAIEAGVAELVGARADRIVAGVNAALERPLPVDRTNPYGDGRAAQRIVEELRHVADRLR